MILSYVSYASSSNHYHLFVTVGKGCNVKCDTTRQRGTALTATHKGVGDGGQKRGEGACGQKFVGNYY